MMAAILNSAILDSAILQKNSGLRHLVQSDSNSLINSLNLMMAAILNSDSLTGFSYFAQKKLHWFFLTQLDDCSHLEFWPCWIQRLPSWIQTTCYLLSDSLKKHSAQAFWLWLKLFSQIWLQTHSFSLNLMMAVILNSGHLGFSHFAKIVWLKLVQSDSNSLILTQLDDGSHLEFCHYGFSYFAQKKTSLILSDWTWWWQPSWILPCWIQTLAILDSDTLSSSLRLTQKHSPSTLTLTQTNSIWLKLDNGILILNSAILDSAILHKTLTHSWIQSDSKSFILTQLDYGSHLNSAIMY